MEEIAGDPNSQYSILLVEDDALVANSLGCLLREEGFDVSICPDPRTALNFCERRTFDLIITDQRLPVMDGTEFAALARIKQPAARVVLISGYGDSAVVQALEERVVHQHVAKPWNNDELVGIVQQELRLAFDEFSVRESAEALTV